MPLRVLQVIDGMHPRDGGPPTVVAGAAQALQAAGLDVGVLTSVQPGDQPEVRSAWKLLMDRGVELSLCPPVSPAALFGSGHLLPEIRALIDASDVIHLHGLWSPLLTLVARYAHRHGKPYFVSIHGLLDHRAMSASRSKWIKKRLAVRLFGLDTILANAAGVIFGSQNEADESWVPTRRMHRLYVPNGVDAQTGVALPSVEERKRLLEVAPNFSNWERTLLIFSRIHPKKGLDMLVQAFNGLVQDYPGTGLLIAGIEQDKAYESVVRKRVAACPVPGRIEMTTELTGPRSRFVYSLCDVFVLPSHAEGFSMAMTEAMAHGIPMLITRFCHVPEVQSSGAGLVVEPTPAALEAGLRELLSRSDSELADIGKRARALFEDRFTWDRVAQQLKDMYISAAGRGAML